MGWCVHVHVLKSSACLRGGGSGCGSRPVQRRVWRCGSCLLLHGALAKVLEYRHHNLLETFEGLRENSMLRVRWYVYSPASCMGSTQAASPDSLW